ncbi:MAG: tRNA-binding protein [Bacteroidia bacterium]
MISWKEFEKVDMRVGTIIEATPFTEARKPAFKLKLDFGPQIGIKNSSAQITELYTPDELNGKQIVAVMNFPPKQIGPFISECLVMGIYNKKGIVLIEPNHQVNNGDKIG